MPDSFKTISSLSEGIYKEKGSKFLSFAIPVTTVEEVKVILDEYRKKFYDARHVCYAYMLGAERADFRANDDGEPSGTAGKPMLAQLMGSGVGEIAAVVVRYYGGILLGTGGLVKAYGNGVQQALKILPTRTQVPKSEYHLVCDYAQLAMVEALLLQVDGQILQADYGAEIGLILLLPTLNAESIADKLRDVSRGALLLSPVA